MARGLALDYRVRVPGVPTHWRSVIAEYDPPCGPLGTLVHRAVIRSQLDVIFEVRRARIEGLLGTAAPALPVGQ